jgi:hypothetical protein
MQAEDPLPWLGNAGGASVSQGLCSIRTSAMYRQGFYGQRVLYGHDRPIGIRCVRVS